MKKPTDRPQAVDVDVGRRVKALRLSVGMSQERLATILGVTYQQIQKYERGANRIGSSRLAQIATALGVSISTLFEDRPGIADAAPQVGLAEAPSSFEHAPTAPTSLRAARDRQTLLRAFDAIQDPVLRRRVVDLVQAIAERDGSGSA